MQSTSTVARLHLGLLPQEAINRKVDQGVGEFVRIFDKKTLSTVAPRYLWGPRAEIAWKRRGIRYIHGVNRQGGHNRKGRWLKRYGQASVEGLCGIPRSADLDIQNGVFPSAADAVESACEVIDKGQPCVLSTHDWNYHSTDSEVNGRMLSGLDSFLSFIEAEYPGLT